MKRLRFLVALSLSTLALGWAHAQDAKKSEGAVGSASKESIEAALQSVVKITTKSVPNARSNATLGDEREGNGVLLENDLAVTIGYLILEADEIEVTDSLGKKTPATVAGYDHSTGFGLVRLTIPSRAKPVPLGQSKAIGVKEPVLSVPFGGIDATQPAFVVSKRVFTGSWEYMLDEALYTFPPIRNWGGAGLFSKDGMLVGVGSLYLRDADGEGTPGNMFVPVDLIKPIYNELKTLGRVKANAKPWLGLSTEERARGLIVSRASPEGPADKAGIEQGDAVVAVNGKAVKTQAEFYAAIWASGNPGAKLNITIRSNGEVKTLEVVSMDRMDYIKPRTTL
jgi:S1-C subfamily serine protease